MLEDENKIKKLTIQTLSAYSSVIKLKFRLKVICLTLDFHKQNTKLQSLKFLKTIGLHNLHKAKALFSLSVLFSLSLMS